MYTYQQRLEYIQRLHELVVLKSNIHLTYKYKNRNKAIAKAQSLQDKIINSIIDEVVYGNSNSVKNIDKTIQELMYTTLENERKRIHYKEDRQVNRAVELNAEKYSNILTNRINTEAVKLQAKIESEMASGIHNDLSEAQTKKVLKETYKDTAKSRIKNIIHDSVHTNESNISFIKALNDGYSYKVWMNGRGKGKVREWHKAKFINPVPIDEYFVINGPRGKKHSMYPGDLYSGAENVANCRCWLRYTNRKPEGLSKKQNVFNIPSSSYLNNQNNQSILSNIKSVVSKPVETVKASISNSTRKVTSKIKNIGKNLTAKITTPKNQKNKFNNLFSLNKHSEKIKSKNKSNEKTKSYHEDVIFSGIDVSYTKKTWSKFKRIIKTKYLDNVLKHFEYFKQELNKRGVDRTIEHCTIRKADGTIVEFYDSNQHENVAIPGDIQEEGRKKYIHTTIHSHPEGTSPISSPEDISKYAECGVINGVSHNELGTMIVVNNDVGGNKKKFKTIEKGLMKIRNDMIKDFVKYKNNNQPIDLKNGNDLKRLNKYVNMHTQKYVKRYNKFLKKYKIKVKFNK